MPARMPGKEGGAKKHLLLRPRHLLVHVAEPVLPAHQHLRLAVRQLLVRTGGAVCAHQMLLMLLMLMLLLLFLVTEGLSVRELETRQAAVVLLSAEVIML